MAPGSNKRKRPERGYSYEDGQGRPSPHRPDAMNMAHNRSGGGRGGRGGTHRRPARNDEHPNSTPATPQIPNHLQSESTPISAVSETSTPIQPLSTPFQIPFEAPVTDPPTIPALYAYDDLTDEILASWSSGGKSSFLDLARDADEIGKSSILQDLIRSVLDRRIDAKEGGSVLHDIISNDKSEDSWSYQDCFVQTISLLDDSDFKNPLLQFLVGWSNIDPELFRLELDIPLLGSLMLVRNTFNQMRTRKTTNILYRQANFNLLREESEGYAKLLTEYFNTAQEASSNREYNYDMAEDGFQRVMALVGAFDLDVGRVLDITLDISANLLVKAYGFFMKFYRCSSWWPKDETFDNIRWTDQGFSSFPAWALPGSLRTSPTDEERENLIALRRARDIAFWQRVSEIGTVAFYDLGCRQILDFDGVSELLNLELGPELDAKGKETRAHQRKRINENRKYMRETKTLPPPGNPDAAQLLGFKLRYYASAVRDAQDTIAENLVALAALLIKIGFISLRDLYPHLHPRDEDMPQERTRLEKEKAEKEAKERPGAGLNALVLAGALPDDLPVPARNTRIEKEKSGANTPKPEVANEPPEEVLPAPDNQKIMLLRALLLVGALPEALYILGRFPWLIEVDTSIPPHLLRIAKQMLSGVSESVRPLSDRADLDETKGQLSDAPSKPGTTLSLVTRPARKSIRWLGLDKVDDKDGQEYRYYYPDWADNVPVCQTIDDVFLLCETFIGLLGVKIGQDADILGNLIRIAKFSLNSDESESNRSRWLDLMKRLLVPALSFTKHNPGLTYAMFELLLYFPLKTRFNIYAEWFTGKTSRLPDMQGILAYNKAEAKDVLRRITNDNFKKYARALAKITYSSPGVVMMYMINQLESYSNMIPALVECARYFPAMAYDVLNWCLINSLSGGGKERMQADGMLTSPWLQALSSYVASVFSRYHHVLDPAPILQYLATELRAGNSTNLEMFEQLLGEMAGIKAENHFNDAQVQAMAGGAHLQSIVLQQLADTRHLRKSPAKRLVRALTEPGLVGQLLIAVAQERQMYQHQESSGDMPLKVLTNNIDKIQQVLAQYLEVLRTYLVPNDFTVALPDVVSLIEDFGLEAGIAFTICRSNILHSMAEYDETKKQEEIEDRKRRQSSGKPADDDSTLQNTEVKPTAFEISPWHPVLLPIIESLQGVAGDINDRVGLPFYVTFWTLAQSDIVVFTESYTAEIDRLSRQMSLLSAERNDSTTTMREKERKKRALQELSDNLRHEVKIRVALYSKVSNRLSHREKAHWFSKVTRRQELDARHVHLIQDCFLPRAIMSAVDAHYSYLMFRLLHDKGTPGFSTANLLSQLFRKHELAAIMFQCTALEAQHFARFLNEILRMLLQWHGDKAIYEKEAIGTKTKLPGFAKPFEADSGPEVFVDYESFRRLVSNWHTALSGALQICFETTEYSHIRNGIMVLKGVCQHFPALNYMGRNLLGHITRLSQEETRQDLKLMAMSLVGPLKNREKKWVDAAHFRLGDPTKDAKAARSAQTKTETPSNSASKLSAAALEFDPKATNGETKGENIEDGEVEDAKVEAKDGDVANTGSAAEPQVENGANDKSSKNTTQPIPPSNGIPSKPEGKRLQQTPTGPTRQPHDLPSRPDKPLPRSTDANTSLKPPPPARHGDRGQYRNEDNQGRLERHTDSRLGTRDNSPNRGRARTPPGPARADSHRENGPPTRLTRVDATQNNRKEPAGRTIPSTHDESPAPSTHPDRAGFISSVVATPVSSVASPNGPTDGSHFENPARLAQINSDQIGRDHPGDGRADTRHRPRVDHARAAPSRIEQLQDVAPTGPRRSGNRFPGRDMATSIQATESSYGRLNNPSDAPSGPRVPVQAPPARSGRNAAIPPAAPASSNVPERPHDNHHTRGPSQSFRNEGRSPAHGTERRPGNSHAADVQSVNDIPLVGIHPSRLAQLSSTANSGPAAQGSPPQGPRNAQTQPQAPSGPRGPARNSNGTPGGPNMLSPDVDVGPGSNHASSRAPPNMADRPRNLNKDGPGPRPNMPTNSNSNSRNSSPAPHPSSRDVSFRGASSRQPSFTKNDGGMQSIASPVEPPIRRPAGQMPDGPSARPLPTRPDLLPRADENGGRNGVLRSNIPRDQNLQNDMRSFDRDRMDAGPPRNRPNAPLVDQMRDKRLSWDPRNTREEPHDRRGPDIPPRNDDVHLRRPVPDPHNYGPPRSDWTRAPDPRGPPSVHDNAQVDGPRRGGRPNARPDDFRGPPASWFADRSAEGLAPPLPPAAAEGRKRRHDESAFDGAKRRRSAR